MKLRNFFASLNFQILGLITVLVLSSCSVEDQSEINGFASFSFDEIAESQGRTSSNASVLVVTLVDQNGTAIMDSESISLFNFNGSYVTESISLPVGNYSLTEYNVLDESMNIIYSTPLDGSDLAHLVDLPLPIPVQIEANKSSKINPQVLSTAGFTPEQFGFTSFGFNIAETVDFLASALIYNSDPLILNWELTDATMEISSAGSVLHTTTLEALTNHIILPAGYESYDLTVTKAGYTSQVMSYTKSELEAFLTTPLTVFLQ